MGEKFADTSSLTFSGSYGRVGNFVKLIPDFPAVLFVLENVHQEDPERAHIRWTHWLPQALRADGHSRGLGITCPGPQICPVCLNNQKIKNAFEGKRGYRNHKEYISSRKRFLTNVFDITDVKKCKCGAIYFPYSGEYPDVCEDDSCAATLGEPEPLKRIRVLEGSATLFENFNSFMESVTDAEGNQIDLREYPIKFVVSGSGTQKTITPIPMIMSTYKRPTEEDFTLSDGTVQEVYDLVEFTASLAPDEITHLVEGGGIRDIWEARAQTSSSEEEIPW